MGDETMSGAAFCEKYVAVLEAIRDALVGIEDEPMSTVRDMAEQAIEGDPEGAAQGMRYYVDERLAIQEFERGPEGEALGTPIYMAEPPQAIQSKSALKEPPDEEQPK
jgi:hypothetical protein